MTMPNLKGPWGIYHPGGGEWFISTTDALLFAQVFSDDLTVAEVEETAALFVNARETKAQRDELLAALAEMKAVVAEPFDGVSNFSSDKVKAIHDLCAKAIANCQKPKN